MSLLDDFDTITKNSDESVITRVAEINAEEFYANDLLAAFSACGVIAKEKEDVLTKIISEAWKRNLNYKTSFAERVENKIKGAINP